MDLSNVAVDQSDVQKMDINIDLVEVVGQHVNSPSDVKDVLANVDDDDIAKFVVQWLEGEASSGEFQQAISHTLYAPAMLNIASEMLDAATRDVEDEVDGIDKLAVVTAVANEFVKPRRAQAMKTFLRDSGDTIADEVKRLVNGDESATLVETLDDVSALLTDMIPNNRRLMDDTSLPLDDRVIAGRQIGRIQDALEAIASFKGTK